MAERSYINTGITLSEGDTQLQVFPFWPNYRRDFIERWEWSTDILQSYNGDEQRICTRPAPRRYFEYEVFARGSDRAALESYIYAGQHKLFLIPDWNRGKKVPSSVMINGEEASLYPTGLGLANTLFTPTGGEHPFAFVTLDGVAVDDHVIGFLAPDWHEIRKVIAVHQDYGIQLDVDTQWPVGTIVCPLVKGRLNQSQIVNRVTPDFSYAVVTFNVLSKSYPYETGSLPFPSYSGHGRVNPYPVVDLPYDWSEEVSVEYEYRTDLIDNHTANPILYSKSLVPEITKGVKWFLNSREQVIKYLQLINHTFGRLEPFWWSSNTKDLIPLYLDTNTQLDVLPMGTEEMMESLLQKTSYYDTQNQLIYGTHLQITSKSGVVHQTAISSSILTTAHSKSVYRIIVRDAIPFSLSDIKMISFLRLARFDNDRIEIAYKGPGFAMAANSIKVLKYVV